MFYSSRCQWKSPSLCSAHSNTSNNQWRKKSAYASLSGLIMSQCLCRCFFSLLCFSSAAGHFLTRGIVARQVIWCKAMNVRDQFQVQTLMCDDQVIAWQSTAETQASLNWNKYGVTRHDVTWQLSSKDFWEFAEVECFLLGWKMFDAIMWQNVQQNFTSYNILFKST